MANPWEMDWSQPQGGTDIAPDPILAQRAAEEEERRRRAEGRADIGTGISQRGEARASGNDRVSHVTKLASDFNADPAVKAYRVAIAQFAQALGTGDGPQADLALTYAFAKAMDPDSVVRESEQGMVTSSQPMVQSAIEAVRKQFGVDGAGNFTPEARQALRMQISNAVAQRAKVYDARRAYYEKQAGELGIEPQLVVGEHDAKPFLPAIQQWVEKSNGKPEEPGLSDAADPAAPDGQEFLGYGVNEDGSPYPVYGFRNAPGGTQQPAPGFQESFAGQGISGVNEGMASALGLPVDLATAGMNLIPQGVNAVANTNIPQIENPVLGSQWFKDQMGDWAIYDQTNDPSKQFVRRVGESVGAGVIPAGASSSLSKALGVMIGSAGGGIGGATAQQIAPGNPYAEFAGEVAGGAIAGGTLMNIGRNRAQRQIEANIPTVDQLKDQAGNMYRQAEQRGVTADPTMTTQLRDNMAMTLRREGQLGPNGKITDADSATTKAFNLIEQYAGQPMTPAEMNTVRTVISDGRKSMDPSDQRLAGVLLDEFDMWSQPLAPEFAKARDISSRYLQAQDLEEARELAGANASQFTGSGFENALRTQYRQLDRNTVRGKDRFKPEVTEAIQNVSRGTPLSNAARALGRFAPTGPVSTMGSVFAPAGIGAMVGGPTGAVVGGTLGTTGMIGRGVATKMGIRGADVAELTARNGAPIPQAPLIDPQTEQMIATTTAAQLAKYLDDRRNKPRGLFGQGGY